MTSKPKTGAVAGDVVAVQLPHGEAWRGIVESVWTAEAVLFPVDPRLPVAATSALLGRARATMFVHSSGWQRLDDGVRAPDGAAVFIATSGSGGPPRVVELSRAAVSAAVQASTAALGAGPDDGWVAALPPFHIGGLLVLLRALLQGVPLGFADAAEPWSLAGRPHGSYISLVPTVLQRALDAGVDLRAYRAVLVGGAACPSGLASRALHAGVRCIATYGLTESCGGVVYDGVPLPGVGVRVGHDAAVELSGPTLMTAYRDDPRAGGSAMLADGWMRTGDTGNIDELGRLHVTGRLDDLIITGGEKVWPADVEAALAEHPDVAEAAVTGVADAVWGTRVVALIVPRTPSALPGLDALRDVVGARLGRHQAPRDVVFLDHLPRTPSGKLARSELPLRAAGDADVV